MHPASGPPVSQELRASFQRGAVTTGARSRIVSAHVRSAGARRVTGGLPRHPPPAEDGERPGLRGLLRGQAARDRSRPITLDAIQEACEHLALRRDTHLDQLVDIAVGAPCAARH